MKVRFKQASIDRSKASFSFNDFLDSCYETVLQSHYRRLFLNLLAFSFSIISLIVRLPLALPDAGYPFVTFYPAIALSAVYLGLEPALVATAASATMAGYFFFAPYSAFIFEFQDGVVWPISIFCLGNIISSLAIGSMHQHYFENKKAIQTLGEARFRQVVEMAPCAMVMVNEAGQINMVNVKAEEIFGYQRKELLGLSIDQLLPERYRGHHPQHIRHFFANPSSRPMAAGREMFARRKDGSEFPVEIGLNPIKRSIGMEVLSTIVDISERKRMEQDLQEKEAHFRMLIENVKDYSIIALDKNGYVVKWNLGAERLKGYRADEIIGQHYSLFYPKEEVDQGKINEILAIAARDGIFEDEGWRVRQDGSQFMANVAINAVFDSTGALQGFVKITRDITERIQREEQLYALNNLHQAILDSTNFSIISTNSQGIIEIFNKSAERMLGYSAGEVRGKMTPAVIHDAQEIEARAEQLSQELGEVIEPGFEAFVAKSRRFTVPDENEWIYIRKDGSRFPVLLSVTTLHNSRSEISGFVGVALDITERKQAEADRIQLMNQLQRINQELNNFAYVASHDLKSPLHGIDQLATWITEDLGETLNADTQVHLRLMRSRIMRMEMLLDDLLTYSRVGRSNEEITNVNTLNLIQGIFELVSNTKQIRLLVAEDLPELFARKVPLELVFRNLIANAIKHHDKPQGAIEISARPVEDGFEFAVKDDGPGIPPEHQERVFAMFQTLRPRDEVEGSGIGLALVKKAVESEGGRVMLHSEGKLGCTFYFTWPTTPRIHELN